VTAVKTNMPNLLGLDIAFGAACACINRQDGSCFSRQTESNRPHSQAIMPMLEALLIEAELTWNDLELLACGIGPGSFTGLRIASATISGINSALNLPVLEISSLAISAAQVKSGEPLYIIEDARADMAYVGHYQGHSALQKDMCITWDELAEYPAAAYSGQQEESKRLANWHYLLPEQTRLQAMAQLLAAESANITSLDRLPRHASPAYINPSQAERNVARV